MRELKFIINMISEAKLLFLYLSLLQAIDIVIVFNIPNIIENIIDKSVPNNDIREIVILVITCASLYLISHVCTFLTEFIFSKTSLLVNYNIKNNLISTLYELDGEELDTHQPKLFSLFISDCVTIDSFVSKGLSNVITSSLYLITIVVVLLLKSILLTIILCISLFLVVLIQNKINKKITLISKIMINKFDLVIVKIKNIISNISKVVTIDNDNYIKNKYLRDEYKYLQKRQNLNIIFSVSSILPSLIISITSIIIIGLGSYLIINNTLTIGTLSIFIFYSNRLASPVNDLINFYSGWQQVKISLNRCISIMEKR
ncbi:ABC transporter ATP-binding protein [Staphylococcus felis]|uniref:ABC transporter transmembrane domain-containing protein n=2 Tax=Staphylococcus felis TaxID=46127 RepID=UPI000E2692C7|nr:ABC transporter ATP-binding protein [Staphylococcus felis]REH77022.1 ABC transporter ATP-binding protein [Staphylococcus felis]REH90936.1 ABC transporter ATP-binding protein [Staphylococcus felis]REI29074.1 ABC transporter ATP-binding protein [Staphylococcus felis]